MQRSMINCNKLTQSEDGPDQRPPAQPPACHCPGQHGPQHEHGGVVETRNINLEMRNRIMLEVMEKIFLKLEVYWISTKTMVLQYGLKKCLGTFISLFSQVTRSN